MSAFRSLRGPLLVEKVDADGFRQRLMSRETFNALMGGHDEILFKSVEPHLPPLDINRIIMEVMTGDEDQEVAE